MCIAAKLENLNDQTANIAWLACLPLFLLTDALGKEMPPDFFSAYVLSGLDRVRLQRTARKDRIRCRKTAQRTTWSHCLDWRLQYSGQVF